MQRSTHRILTTHCGSLPRPNDLLEMLMARDRAVCTTCRPSTLACAKPSASASANRETLAWTSSMTASGASLTNRPTSRTVLPASRGADADRHRSRHRQLPGYVPPPRRRAADDAPQVQRPYRLEGLRRRQARHRQPQSRCRQCRRGLHDGGIHRAGRALQANSYYKSGEEYLWALADVLKDEYKAITDAGFTLQLDRPDLASG